MSLGRLVLPAADLDRNYLAEAADLAQSRNITSVELCLWYESCIVYHFKFILVN